MRGHGTSPEHALGTRAWPSPQAHDVQDLRDQFRADRAARRSGTVAKYLQATAVSYEAQARLPGFKCYNKVEFSCAGDVLIIKTSRKRLALQHTLMIEEELIQAHATILKHECTIAELRSKRIKTEPQC